MQIAYLRKQCGACGTCATTNSVAGSEFAGAHYTKKEDALR
ncbi:hypothetical protein SAMN04515695_1135 [Pseudovibrio sp. Tun.PSC04-5.I4]|nr:hypothetical protein SAMN04515695_1135 [Pseudovibrio sp. Tun.PSC04-5.I4]